MKKLLLFIVSLLLSNLIKTSLAQDSLDVTQIGKPWKFGALPVIAYDSDRGLKYGGLINFYHFGDYSIYPKYRHSVYIEWSRTTKGSGINQFLYDSEYLIPNIRVSAEASLLTDQALDFYGFNGYDAYYNDNFEDDAHETYISRMFYKTNRQLLRIKAEFQGKILENKVRWFAGFSHFNNKISTVDINRLNKGKDEEDMLPDTALLYDKYLDWNVIPSDQKDGGTTNLIKVGIIYDTRDNEPNPMKGIWTDLQIILAPAFLDNQYTYKRIAITHRQYFTLIKNRLSFVYRLSYQAKISGDMPYYMLPYVFNTAPYLAYDGLGGKKTLRGIQNDRIVGEDFIYGNLEFRWKIFRTKLFKNNFYLAFNTFLDFGRVTGKYKIDTSGVPADQMFFFKTNAEKMHYSYGGGLRFVLNDNFIVAADYGRTIDTNDGIAGLYLGMDYLF